MRRIILVLVALSLAGCTSTSTPTQAAGDPVANCITMCEGARTTTLVGQDLSAGPCLGMVNNEYVCDIAHNPRQAVDNKSENQCDAWHDGTAQGFVEVTPECEFITVYHK